MDYDKCLAIRLTVYGDSNHPDIATSYNNMGLVYYSQAEYAKALESYNKCLAIQLTVYGDSNHPAIAISCNNVGSVYNSQGEYAKALECDNKFQSIRSAPPPTREHKWLSNYRITSAFHFYLIFNYNYYYYHC